MPHENGEATPGWNEMRNNRLYANMGHAGFLIKQYFHHETVSDGISHTR